LGFYEDDRIRKKNSSFNESNEDTSGSAGEWTLILDNDEETIYEVLNILSERFKVDTSLVLRRIKLVR
jgi:hypothetical protein